MSLISKFLSHFIPLLSCWLEDFDCKKIFSHGMYIVDLAVVFWEKKFAGKLNVKLLRFSNNSKYFLIRLVSWLYYAHCIQLSLIDLVKYHILSGIGLSIRNLP